MLTFFYIPRDSDDNSSDSGNADMMTSVWQLS